VAASDNRNDSAGSAGAYPAADSSPNGPAFWAANRSHAVCCAAVASCDTMSDAAMRGKILRRAERLPHASAATNARVSSVCQRFSIKEANAVDSDREYCTHRNQRPKIIISTSSVQRIIPVVGFALPLAVAPGIGKHYGQGDAGPRNPQLRRASKRMLTVIPNVTNMEDRRWLGIAFPSRTDSLWCIFTNKASMTA
jgi:hypothetical protein